MDGKSSVTRKFSIAEASLMVCVLVFWIVRGSYWNSTVEVPFSDMADYDRVAHGVAAHFSFAWDSFWWTYTTPTLVFLRGVQIWLLGDSLLAWRILQAAVVFVATFWLGVEVARRSGSKTLALFLLCGVALSVPSIFWSLKLSREGLAEGFIALNAAMTLWALRGTSRWRFFWLGLAIMVGALNRPTTLPFVAVPAVLVLLQSSAQRGERRAFGWGCGACAALSLGVFLAWIPWGARNYSLYGAPVWFSNQPPFVFFWELGEVTLDVPGEGRVRFTSQSLQNEAPHRFKDDRAASQYAQKLVALWMEKHSATLFRSFRERAERSILIRGEYLSTVPREHLFGDLRDWLLFDKSYVGVIGALIGYGISLLWAPVLAAVLCTAALIPWLSSVLLLGYPRMLDPSLPLLLFGWAIGAYAVAMLWFQKRSRTTPLRSCFTTGDSAIV